MASIVKDVIIRGSKTRISVIGATNADARAILQQYKMLRDATDHTRPAPAIRMKFTIKALTGANTAITAM